MEQFFEDYMSTERPLTKDEQNIRFTDMHITEIKERALLLKGLNYDKETVKKRIKTNIEWGFDLCELPTFYKEVDTIVDRVYSV